MHRNHLYPKKSLSCSLLKPGGAFREVKCATICLLQSEASGQSQTSAAWFVSMEWEGDANKTG